MWYLQVPSTSSLHRVRYWWIDGLILAPHRHQDGDGGSDAFEFWNYFFFFFMEAISCSAFDSCLAIADTWDEKESRWNEEVNVETQCWKAPPLPSSAASLPSEPWPPPRLPRLLAAPGPQPPAWCSIIILFLLLQQIPLYFCLQGGAVGVVLSHDHSLFLMKKRVLAFQSSSWSNGQNFHNKLFFLSCANFHIHSSLDSIYLIRKLRSKINYLCSSKPESCHPSGTSGFQRLF